MITFISLIYASFYFLVFGKGLVKKNGRNVSIFVGVGVVLIGAIIFSWLTFAPTTQDGRVFQYVIPIVPKVAGAVIEVPAKPLVPMREDDVLFLIEPDPFQYALYNVCEGADGTCLYRRQNVPISVKVLEGVVSSGRSGGPDRARNTP